MAEPQPPPTSRLTLTTQDQQLHARLEPTGLQTRHRNALRLAAVFAGVGVVLTILIAQALTTGRASLDDYLLGFGFGSLVPFGLAAFIAYQAIRNATEHGTLQANPDSIQITQHTAFRKRTVTLKQTDITAVHSSRNTAGSDTGSRDRTPGLVLVTSNKRTHTFFTSQTRSDLRTLAQALRRTLRLD